MRTLKIEDKDYPIVVRWSTIKNFCLRKEIDISGWADFILSLAKIPSNKILQYYNDIVLLIYCSLERGAEKYQKVLDLSQNDVFDWFIEFEDKASIVNSIIEEANGNLPKNQEAPEKTGQS